MFVFDGGVPVLKRRTIEARRQRRQHSADTHAAIAKRLFRTQLQKHLNAVKQKKRELKKNGAGNRAETAERPGYAPGFDPGGQSGAAAAAAAAPSASVEEDSDESEDIEWEAGDRTKVDSDEDEDEEGEDEW